MGGQRQLESDRLWNPRSPIIYLWTAEQASPWEAYYVTYNGSVHMDSKYAGLESRGYRCVRGELY
jgi:hypothetical protein